MKDGKMQEPKPVRAAVPPKVQRIADLLSQQPEVIEVHGVIKSVLLTIETDDGERTFQWEADAGDFVFARVSDFDEISEREGAGGIVSLSKIPVPV